MKQATDAFVYPDTQITYLSVGEGVAIRLGAPVFNLTLFFNTEALHQLLQLANVCETAWSTTLKEDS